MGHAQDWARAMFEGRASHDFGVVARGAKVEHRFVLENTYEEDVRIKSVSSSCGCSKAQINKQLLKTWEKAEVLVTVDTRSFLGRREATIRVELELPSRPEVPTAELQFHVYTYIRSDIVVQPGSVSFGTIMQAAGAEKTLTVDYAVGREDWRIERVECSNPNIEARATPTAQTPGQIHYSLSVKLKPEAPPGYLRDQLVLVTNDFESRATRVPVAIEGLVVAPLSARPSPLLMGVAEAGKSVTRNLVVQGRAPFRITAARCEDPRFKCKLPGEAKTAHVVPVTFLDPKGPASGTTTVQAKIRFETDLSGAGAVEVPVSVQLGAPAAGAKP